MAGRKKEEKLEKKELKLTPEEHRIISLDHLEIDKIELESQLWDERINSSKLKFNLYDRETRLLKYILAEQEKSRSELQTKLENRKLNHKEVLKNVAKRLELKEGSGFGFNPETGEVIL